MLSSSRRTRKARPIARTLAWALVSLAGIAAASLAAIACSSDEPEASGGEPGAEGGAVAQPDGNIAPRDADTPSSTLRLANLGEGLGAIDFCYRSAKTSAFEGPVLARGIGGSKKDAGDDASDADPTDPADAAGDADADADADVGDAGTLAVGSRSVSRYLSLPVSGALTFAFVPPGSTSCASPLFTGDVTIDPGKLTTVAILGVRQVDASSSASLGLATFIDEGRTTADRARVRLVHAALGNASREASPALSARAVGAQIIALADRVEPRGVGASSAQIPIDALGYATIAPVPAPAQLAVTAADGVVVDAEAPSWISEAGELGLSGGSVHTGFVLSGDTSTFEVLWCSDINTTAEQTSCELVR